MADPSTSTSSAPLMAGAGPPPLPQELLARSKQLGKILGIPVSTFTSREMPAYQIMAHLAAMPTVKEFDRRRAYGNEILGNLNKLMPISDPDNQPFYGRVAPLVGQMQEFPAWFANLAKSNEELVSEYVLLDTILTGMAWAGVPSLVTGGSLLAGAGKSAVSKGVIGAARKYEARGALSGVDLAAGMGKAGLAGARGALTGGFATSLAAVWLIGAATATALTIEQNEIKAEIIRRFQNRTLSSDLYQKALGDSLPLPQQYFYDLS